jgi:hypothetical protein
MLKVLKILVSEVKMGGLMPLPQGIHRRVCKDVAWPAGILLMGWGEGASPEWYKTMSWAMYSTDFCYPSQIPGPDPGHFKFDLGVVHFTH